MTIVQSDYVLFSQVIKWCLIEVVASMTDRQASTDVSAPHISEWVHKLMLWFCLPGAKPLTCSMHEGAGHCVHSLSVWWTPAPFRLCWWSVWKCILHPPQARSRRFPTLDRWSPGRSSDWSSALRPGSRNRKEKLEPNYSRWIQK